MPCAGRSAGAFSARVWRRWPCTLLRIRRDQRGEGAHRRQPTEAVHRGRRRPWQLLIRPGFREGHKPTVRIEHRGPEVDELVHAFGPREHPALAVRAEVVVRIAMQLAEHRLAGRDFEARRWDRERQREGTDAHALAARAVASHRQQFEGRNRQSGKLKRNGTRADLVFGSKAQLRAVAEVHGNTDSQTKLVDEFVAAWSKVLNLDHLTVA